MFIVSFYILIKGYQIIEFFDLTYMISIADLVAINIETLRIDSGYSLEEEFTELIHMNL